MHEPVCAVVGHGGSSGASAEATEVGTLAVIVDAAVNAPPSGPSPTVAGTTKLATKSSGGTTPSQCGGLGAGAGAPSSSRGADDEGTTEKPSLLAGRGALLQLLSATIATIRRIANSYNQGKIPEMLTVSALNDARRCVARRG
jgi:hypothetical protein